MMIPSKRRVHSSALAAAILALVSCHSPASAQADAPATEKDGVRAVLADKRLTRALRGLDMSVIGLQGLQIAFIEREADLSRSTRRLVAQMIEDAVSAAQSKVERPLPLSGGVGEVIDPSLIQQQYAQQELAYAKYADELQRAVAAEMQKGFVKLISLEMEEEEEIRLRQVFLQVFGPRFDDSVGKLFAFTADQQKAIGSGKAEILKKIRTMKDDNEILRESAKSMGMLIQKTLTADQLALWKKLTGRPVSPSAAED